MGFPKCRAFWDGSTEAPEMFYISGHEQGIPGKPEAFGWVHPKENLRSLKKGYTLLYKTRAAWYHGLSVVFHIYNCIFSG